MTGQGRLPVVDELGPGLGVDLEISHFAKAGGIDAAHEVGARSVAITCDPHSPLAEAAEKVVAALKGDGK